MPKDLNQLRDQLLTAMTSVVKKIENSEFVGQNSSYANEFIQCINKLKKAVDAESITAEDGKKILRYILKRLAEALTPSQDQALSATKDQELIDAVKELNEQFCFRGEEYGSGELEENDEAFFTYNSLSIVEDAQVFINAGLVETNSTLYNIAKLIINPSSSPIPSAEHVAADFQQSTWEQEFISPEDCPLFDSTRPSAPPMLAAARLAAARQQSDWERRIIRPEDCPLLDPQQETSSPEQPKPEQPKP